MSKKLLRSLLLSVLILGSELFGEETNKSFSLEVENNRVVLINGEMKVWTDSGKMMARFSGPYGIIACDGFRWNLDKILVKTDNLEEKEVSLFSKVQTKGDNSTLYVLQLKAKKNSPAIELKAIQRNIGNTLVKKGFYYRATCIKFPYYYDKYGFQYAAKPGIELMDWLFFPSANTRGGYVLVPFNKRNVKLTTIFPRADWQAVGLYFNRVSYKPLRPGKSFMKGFAVFPASSQWDAIKLFEKYQHGKSVSKRKK